MAGWMDSGGHRANTLSRRFEEGGVGLVRSGNSRTRDFGTARQESTATAVAVPDRSGHRMSGAAGWLLPNVVIERKEAGVLERLNQAMEHIERHLDQPIEVADLARIAVTSEYHLRRLFSALAGMPLSEYVRRRRLTVAGAEVLADGQTLLEIAVRYGYGSGRRSRGRSVPCTASAPERPGAPVPVCGPSPGCPSASSSKGAAACNTESWRRRSSGWSGGRPVSPSCTRG